MSSFSAIMCEKYLELILSIDEKLPRKLLGDPIRIQQVLTNLISNAFKFTSLGEVELSVSLIGNHSTSQKSAAILLHFAVRDTGTGIKTGYIPKLFDRFSQQDDSTTRKFGGTGLGLSIVKKLTDLMDGKLWVDSTIGQGSTFNFSLPFQVINDPDDTSHPDLKSGLKSMVINSNKVAAKSISGYLEYRKIQTKLVGSGGEALKRLQQETVDLLFIDDNAIDDPVIFFTSLQPMIANSKIPFTTVIFSCFTDRPRMDELDRIENSIQLEKPIEISKLRALIDSVCIIGSPQLIGREKQQALPQNLMKLMHRYRILVVDDIKLNRSLAIAILKPMGAIIEQACNGKIAVEKAYAGDFDLILMDVQMPIMSGFKATSLLRKRFTDLPIIAMTANVMKGYKQQCIDAGMNDCINKPFNANQLSKIVKKWLLLKDNSRSEVFPDVQSSSSESNIREGLTERPCHSPNGLPEFLPGIDIAEGINRWQNDCELYFSHLDEFCEETEKSTEQFTALLSSSKLEEMKFEAHSVSGKASNLSLNELATAAAVIENIINDSNCPSATMLDNYESARVTVCNSNNKLRLQMKEVKSTDSSQPMNNQQTYAVEQKDFSTALQELSILLKQSNPESKAQFKLVEQQLGQHQNISRYLKALEIELKSYRFEDAHTQLRKIANKLDISLGN